MNGIFSTLFAAVGKKGVAEGKSRFWAFSKVKKEENRGTKLVFNKALFAQIFHHRKKGVAEGKSRFGAFPKLKHSK